MNREIGLPTILRPAENLKQENEPAKTAKVELRLSPELREKMSEQMAAIRQTLDGQPELAERLLAQYTRFVESEQQRIAKASKIYDEIFFEKKLDKKEAVETALLRSVEALWEISVKLAGASGNEKDSKTEKTVKEILDDLSEKQKITVRAVEEIKKIAAEVNQMCAEIEQVRIDLFNQEEAMYKAGLAERARELRQAKEKIDRRQFRSEWEQKGWVFRDEAEVEDLISELYDDSEYLLDGDFSEAEFFDEEEKQYKEKFRKYDNLRIQNEIERFEQLYDKDGNQYKFATEYLDPQIAENIKRRSEASRIIFEPLVKKLEKLLHYQKNLEQKLERIIFGNESARLPKDFIKEIRADIRHYKAELPQTQKEAYWPVGVTSLLPQERETHLKPIDALGYLFWLNNQGQKVKFMVVDMIQATNYQALYNLSPEEAKEKAKENGTRDKEWYKAVIDLFHLNNIEMIDFEELEQSHEFQLAQELTSEVESRSPVIKKALSNLVEEGVRKKALVAAGKDQSGSHRNIPEAEKQRISDLLEQYGKTEIAFILAKSGLKIGHEKEYRYDVMARLLPIYRALAERSEEIFKAKKVKIKSDEERDQALVELSLYLSYYRNFPKVYHLAADLFEIKEEVSQKSGQEKQAESKVKKNEFTREKKMLAVRAEELDKKITEVKKELAKDIEAVKKTQKTIKGLGLLPDEKQTPDRVIQKWRKIWEDIPDKAWLESLDLPEFFYPAGITGMSFELADEKGQEQKGFREFYSTHKKELEQEKELALAANQVVASTDFMAVAKLAALSEKLQQEYFEKILRPILVNYYIARFRGGEAGTNLQRRALNKSLALARARDDLAEIKTITEAVDFIQRKIVWPIEIELKHSL